MYQHSHPLSRRLVLQTKTNDGLTLWGRARPRHHAAILSLGFFAQGFYRHTQVRSLAVVRLMQLCDEPSHLWTLRSCSSTTMRPWKPGSASEEPRFLSPLEGFEGRNRSSRVVLWHLRRGKHRLEDPLSRLCLSDQLDSGLENPLLCNIQSLSFRNCGTTAKSPRFRCSLLIQDWATSGKRQSWQYFTSAELARS